MSYSTSLLSYTDISTVLDRALGAEKGVRIEFESKPEAMRFLTRMSQFRSLERKANRTLYPEDHQFHGASPYDTLRPIKPKDGREVWSATPEGKWPVEIRKLDELDIVMKLTEIV